MRYKKVMTTVDETNEFAHTLAKLVHKQDVILLEGDLGAGKTTFAKAFAKGIGVKRVVSSPTFTIMKQYEGRLTFNHLDVYRLADSEEDLGWEEIFYGEAVTLVEWAHLIEEDLPVEYLKIDIRYIDMNTREFILTAKGIRYEQMLRELKG